MKNTAEFIRLVNGMKHEDLVRMARHAVAKPGPIGTLVEQFAHARTFTREELIAAVIRERYEYRLAQLTEYLAARAARGKPGAPAPEDPNQPRFL